MKKLFINLNQLSEITGLPRATIKRLANQGKLPVLNFQEDFDPI
jgi:predicted DNA-binding transcriptional regulator AlpA